MFAHFSRLIGKIILDFPNSFPKEKEFLRGNYLSWLLNNAIITKKSTLEARDAFKRSSEQEYSHI